MTPKHPLFAFVILAAFAAHSLIAAEGANVSDVLGTWTIESPGRDGQVNRSMLIIKEEGGKLVGKLISDRGERPVSQVKYAEGQLTLVLSFERNGVTRELHYTAKPTGEKMEGKAEFKGGERNFTFDFKGTRIARPTGVAGTAADVLGNWALKLILPDGRTFEPMLTLGQTGGALTGKLATQQFGDLPISEAAYEGGRLSFTIAVRGDDGNTYKTVYRVQVSGRTFKGKAEFDFNGQTGSLDIEGERQESRA
jgi:hypothetical protein